LLKRNQYIHIMEQILSRWHLNKQGSDLISSYLKSPPFVPFCCSSCYNTRAWKALGCKEISGKTSARHRHRLAELRCSSPGWDVGGAVPSSARATHRLCRYPAGERGHQGVGKISLPFTFGTSARLGFGYAFKSSTEASSLLFWKAPFLTLF